MLAACWADAGALAFDLATAAVLAAAAHHGPRAGALLAITRAGGERLADERLDALEAALGAVALRGAAPRPLGGSDASRARYFLFAAPLLRRRLRAAAFAFGAGRSTSSRSCSRGTGAGAASSAPAELRHLGRELGELRLDRGEPVVGRLGGARDLLEPAVEPVDPVLDPLEPLRDRAQPAREPLEVRGRGQVERAHRGLLRGDRPLARLEGAAERARHDRVLQQVLGELAERVLALAGDPSRRLSPLASSSAITASCSPWFESRRGGERSADATRWPWPEPEVEGQT